MRFLPTKEVGRRIAAGLGIITILLLGFSGSVLHTPTKSMAAVSIVQPDRIDKQYVAALDVARVFGRSQGCADADPKLIDAIATEALRVNMDPRILAALVAVESSCDPMAVSRSGAIGLAQIMPKLWAPKFDFAGNVNLFNAHDNLHAGATILSDLIKQYGLQQGVRRYNGLGTGCPTCDDAYVPKILSLAGRK